MARKPADIVARITVRIPYGQDGIWEAIRALRTFTTKDLRARVAADPRTITGYLDRLEKGGFVRRTDTPALTADRAWEIVLDQPDTPRLRADGTPSREPGRGQENMWRSMKMLDRFDAATLAAAASTDEVRVTVVTAAAYLQRLHRAGYLFVDAPSVQGKGHRRTTYALKPTMNTGPRAPMIQTTDCVFDPNTRTVHELTGGDA